MESYSQNSTKKLCETEAKPQAGKRWQIPEISLRKKFKNGKIGKTTSLSGG
jgi:hypothetical protein